MSETRLGGGGRVLKGGQRGEMGRGIAAGAPDRALRGAVPKSSYLEAMHSGSEDDEEANVPPKKPKQPRTGKGAAGPSEPSKRRQRAKRRRTDQGKPSQQPQPEALRLLPAGVPKPVVLEAEGLKLMPSARSASGYLYVYIAQESRKNSSAREYVASVRGHVLGTFVSAVDAAVAVARHTAGGENVDSREAEEEDSCTDTGGGEGESDDEESDDEEGEEGDGERTVVAEQQEATVGQEATVVQAGEEPDEHVITLAAEDVTVEARTPLRPRCTPLLRSCCRLPPPPPARPLHKKAPVPRRRKRSGWRRRRRAFGCTSHTAAPPATSTCISTYAAACTPVPASSASHAVGLSTRGAGETFPCGHGAGARQGLARHF